MTYDMCQRCVAYGARNCTYGISLKVSVVFSGYAGFVIKKWISSVPGEFPEFPQGNHQQFHAAIMLSPIYTYAEVAYTSSQPSHSCFYIPIGSITLI